MEKRVLYCEWWAPGTRLCRTSFREYLRSLFPSPPPQLSSRAARIR